MPRHRVRVRVVSAESAAALQPALDQALAEEQLDRRWHVSDVTLAPVISGAVPAGDVPAGSFVALISLRKQEWFVTDLLKGVLDFVRGKPSAPDGAAGT